MRYLVFVLSLLFCSVATAKDVTVYTLAQGCAPCQRFKAEAGSIEGYSFKFVTDSPAWVQSFPTMVFPGKDGPLQWSGYQSAATIKAVLDRSYYEVKPPAMKQAAPLRAVNGLSVADIEKYIGKAGEITITPRDPITVTLDDGTKVSFRRLAGAYDSDGKVVILTLSEPLPRVDTTKFYLHFGAVIQSLKYPVGDAVEIGTSRGRYRVPLRLEAVE